jgi:hypothetical protein
MGNEVACILLEKLRDVTGNIRFVGVVSDVEESLLTTMAKTVYEHVDNLKKDMDLYKTNL